MTTTSANPYRVLGSYFETLEEAIGFARDKCALKKVGPSCYVPIYHSDLNKFVAFVTDDANGMVVHKL